MRGGSSVNNSSVDFIENGVNNHDFNTAEDSKNSNEETLQLFNLFAHSETIIRNFILRICNDPDIVAACAKILNYVFWIYGIICILGTIGIDTKPFLTSLNVVLITLGFASKDIITNNFAGIFILLTKPFSRNSIITVNGFRGRVVSIDVRYVKLLNTENGTEVLVPLSMVYGNAIIIERSEDSTEPF
jgi:small-conductance mechanosensitive channel